jgi:hypothetical protein
MAGPYSAFFNPQVFHKIHGSTRPTFLHARTCNPNGVMHSRTSKIYAKTITYKKSSGYRPGLPQVSQYSWLIALRPFGTCFNA